MREPDAEVQELLDELLRTLCEVRDVEAFLALWANDPAISMWGSTADEQAVGRDEIRRLGAEITGSEHTFRFSWDTRRLHVYGDAAWINAVGSVSVDGRPLPYRLTAVFTRTAEGWRCHTFHGSIPD